MNFSPNPAPTPEPAATPAEPDGSKRLALMLGGGAVALGAVGAMAFVLLTGGDDTVPTPVVAGRPGVVATEAPTASPTASAIKRYSGKDARDPFKALVQEAAAAPAAPVVPAAPSSSTTTAGPQVPVPSSSTTVPAPPVVPVPVPSTSTAGPAPSVPAPSVPAPSVPAPSTSAPSTPRPTVAGTKVTMLAVNDANTSATLTVNSKKYAVKEGDTFATSFRLLGMDNGDCAAIQYGDTIFDLCEGDTRYLR